MALYNVLFDIATRTAKFEEGMTRVDRRLEGMQRGAAKLTKNLAGVFATGLIARWVANMAQAGDEMLALANRTGRTVESVSQLSHVAARGNTTIEALTKAQDQLAKRLGATDEEGKAAAKALGELGLSANNIRAMGFDQRLDAIADAMGSITDPTQRARLEIALLGKQGTELDEVLRSGAGGIRELREEADRLGITITQIEAERLSKLDDQIENTKGQFKSLAMELTSLIAIPVAPYIELVTKGIMGWKVMLGVTGVQMEEINSEIVALTGELRKLEDAQRHWDKSDATAARIAKLKEYIAVLGKQQEALLAQPRAQARYEAMDAANRERAAAAAEEVAKKKAAEAKAVEEAAEAWFKNAEAIRAVIEEEQLLNSLELKFPTALLDDDELQRQLDGTGEAIRESAERNEKVFTGMFERVKKSFGASMEEIAAMSDQAWRNIQSHAADFFFDPFSDGMRGLLKGFIDIIRRMIAEAAALQFVNLLRGGANSSGIFGDILGSLFGALPARAMGGPVRGGQTYMVGERGPEAFTAPTNGTIVPNHALGGGGGPVQVNYSPTIHIDSRADRAAIIQDVLRITRASADEVEGRVVEGIRRNRYRLSPA